MVAAWPDPFSLWRVWLVRLQLEMVMSMYGYESLTTPCMASLCVGGKEEARYTSFNWLLKVVILSLLWCTFLGFFSLLFFLLKTLCFTLFFCCAALFLPQSSFPLYLVHNLCNWFVTRTSYVAACVKFLLVRNRFQNNKVMFKYFRSLSDISMT